MRYRELIAAATIPLLLLTACGPRAGNSGSPGAPGSTASEGPIGASSTAAEGPTGAESSTAASPAAGSVDVCALLTDEAAVEVAKNAPLVSAESVTYTIKREKQTSSPEVVKPPLGDCKFYFYSQTSDASSPSISATVQIQANDASEFDIYKSGTPVPGLGDEAYKSTGSTVVRKGNVMLSAGENSATDGFVVAMYRKMVDNLH
jgi:hypothetical protein